MPASSCTDPASVAHRVAASIADGPHRMTVGLRPLDLAAWIEDAPDHDAQLAEKRRLLASRGDVLAALPGSEAACDELLAILTEHLPRHLPHRYPRGAAGAAAARTRGATGTGPDPTLARAAEMVPDDLCLMAQDEQGRYRLVAAALCFPTRWRLRAKLGEPMHVIHAPVPGYAGALSAATDRVLAALTPPRPLWRQNWSLLDSPALYQPVRVELTEPLDPEQFGERLWLRSERQTLRRLPESGAVLFTIRIRQCCLAEVCRVPGTSRRLAAQIRSMPPALKAYKALTDIEPALLGWLDARTA